MNKQISLSEKEIDLLISTLNFKKYEIEKEIERYVSSLDNYLEKILYYNDLIEVDWHEVAHQVYQENKEEYLADSHEGYSFYMKQLTKNKLELGVIEELIEKIFL